MIDGFSIGKLHSATGCRQRMKNLGCSVYADRMMGNLVSDAAVIVCMYEFRK